MRNRTRPWQFAVTVLAASVFVMWAGNFGPEGLVPVPHAYAQGVDDLAEDDLEASPDETPTDAADDVTPTDNWLSWGYRALGLGYSLVFLSLSFTLVALLVMNILTARRENVCPVHLIEGFETHLNEKRYQEAYDLAKKDESFLGQVW